MPAALVPDPPGVLVPPGSDQASWLQRHVAELCGRSDDRFPGSQPISFSSDSLERLVREDFWVCEKSDGLRVLFLICTLSAEDQSVYLIDRHNAYRTVTGFFFPHHQDPRMPLRSSLLDGELVVDVDKRSGQRKLRFLAFDCLAVDGEAIFNRPLDKRYGRLQMHFYEPYKRMMKEHPHMAKGQQFEIRVKPMERAYAIDKVFTVDVPALEHGHDGLIFTCVRTPYQFGTDTNILKWKPPSENSIDFKLVLRFPPTPGGREVDWTARPVFALHTWLGGARYEPFDVLDVDDAEWAAWKSGGEQVDDRIVEVTWDARRERWRKMRFRDDKPNANHRSTVDKIMASIADGVEQETLVARVQAIKQAWKAREGQPATQPAARPVMEMRYGPMVKSRWSKASGPEEVAGVRR